MSAIRFALFAGSLAGLFAVSQPALGAADSAALCADVAGAKAMVAEHHGRWIELSAEQWQFLRGVYAMNPEIPPRGHRNGSEARRTQPMVTPSAKNDNRKEKP